MPKPRVILAALVAILLASHFGHAQDPDASDRPIQRETIEGVTPPGYVTVAPADGTATQVALVLGDTDSDPAELARALAPHVSSGTRIIAPRLAVLGTGGADRGFHRFGGTDRTDADELADRVLARRVIGATLADAATKHGTANLPLSVVGLFDGAALAVEVARARNAGYLLLIDPDPEALPVVDVPDDAPWPAVDVFLNARSTGRGRDLLDTARMHLGNWALTGRFFAGTLRAPGLTELVNEAFGCLKGRRLFDASTGQTVSLEAMIADLATHDVIFAGEHHGNAVAHRTQLAIFRGVLDRHPKTALAMEQFERDAQPWLDKYLAGDIDEATFLANSRPWPNYRDYRPMIELAKERGVPVIAGNIPRPLASRIARGEHPADDFSVEEQSWTARELVVLEDDYLQHFHEAFGDPERRQDLSAMYKAQCSKDDTMAESMHDFLQANAGWKVVHTNGSFHSDYRLGAVQKLALMDGSREIAVVSPLASDNPPHEQWSPELAERGDYVMVIPAERPRRPRRAPNPHSERQPANPHESDDGDPGDEAAQPDGDHDHGEATATDGGATTSDAIAHYHLDVQLLPSEQSIAAQATIDLPAALANEFRIEQMMHGLRIYRIPFWLQPELDVAGVAATAGGELKARSARAIPDAERTEPGARALILAFPGDPGEEADLRVVIEYRGTIHDPVERDSSLTGDSGDRTSGIISEQGVYLAGGGGWYPMLKDQRIARFDVQAQIEAPHHVVTQGQLVQRGQAEGGNVSEWRAELPTPGLSLVAGPYVLTTKETESGVAVTAAFFESEARLGAMFLDYAVATISTYERLIGEFPYASFHIVENFFSTGYGMPGFTLLGKALVSMGPMAFMPGMLDHEIVHSWWGCSVYTDHTRGNWCEAFTSYYTNYLAHEMKGADDAARKMRDQVLAYNTTIEPGAGIPLKDFSWRATRELGAVGYTKGLIFLHHLRGIVGDDAFFATMKQLATDFRGRYMSWNHIRDAFAAVRGDLGPVFDQWLDRADIPDVMLDDVAYDRDAGELTGVIRQLTDSPWHLPGLRLVVTTPGADGPALQFEVNVTGRETSFMLPVGTADRLQVRLANHDGTPLLRRLTPAEYPANMGMLASAEQLVLVIPPEGDDFAAIVEGLQRPGVTVVRGDEATPEQLASGAVLMLGTPDTNPAYQLLAGRDLAGGELTLRDGALYHGDDRLHGDDVDVLAAFDNPFATGHPMAVYLPYSSVGVARTRVIFRYRWDSLVVFRNGRPAQRLAFDAPVNRCAVTLRAD